MKKQHLLILASIVILFGCKKAIFEPEPANNPEALFEDLWGTFHTDYACFDERNVNWQEQYNIFRPQVTDNTNDQDLLKIFKNLLGTLNDGHVHLATPFEENIFFCRQYLQLKNR